MKFPTALAACLAGLLSAHALAQPVAVQVTGTPQGRELAVSLPAADGPFRAFLEPGGVSLQQQRTLPQEIAAATLHNDRLYLGGESRVLALDIESTLEQASLTSLAPTSAQHMAADDKVLVVANDRQLLVLTPASTTSSIAGSVVLDAVISEVAIDEHIAYAGLADNRVVAIDLTDPTQPRRRGSINVPGTVRAMAAQRGRVWVAADSEGVVAVDARDLDRLTLSGRYRTNAPALDIAIAGGIAYVAAAEQGLVLLDTSDAYNPLWMGSYSALGTVTLVEAAPSVAVVANTRDEVAVLDTAFAQLPSITQRWRVQGKPRALLLDGEELYIASGRTLNQWRLHDITPRYSNEDLNAGEGINFGGQRKGFIDGHVLYVADWFSGIHLYDIADADHPKLLSSFHTPGSPKGIVVANGIAYVADDDHGLQVVDVHDPRQPRLVSTLLTEGLAYTPVIRGQHLYLASHRGGFQIIDIHDPLHPRLIGAYDTPGKAWSIDVQGNIAAVADAEAGMLLFDVTEPSKPQLLASYAGGNAEDVLIEGNLAYVALFDQGVQIVDIATPSAPSLLARIATPGNGRGLAKEGAVLYVADWFAGVHVLDVADPENPRRLGSYDTPGAAWGVRVAGSRLFVFDWWGGLRVLDSTNPRQLRSAGAYNQDEPVAAVEAHGKYLLAAQAKRGLQIYDIKNALNPTWVTGLELGGAALDVARSGQVAGVAVAGRGLAFIDVSDPFRPRLRSWLEGHDEIRRVSALASGFVYADATGGLHIVRSADLAKPPLTESFAGQVIDFFIDDQTLFAVNERVELQRFDLSSIPPHRVDTTKLPAAAKFVRADADAIYVYAPEWGLCVYERGTTLKARGCMALPSHVTTLQAASGQLVVADRDDGIWFLVPRHGEMPAVASRYRSATAITDWVHHNDRWYGAADMGVYALQPFAEPVAIDPSGRETRFMVPANLPEGSYNVVIVGGGAGRWHLNDVFAVQALAPRPINN